MNFLFLHQNFPGQYKHLLCSLQEENRINPGTHKIFFFSEKNRNFMPGVHKVTYTGARPRNSSIPENFRIFIDPLCRSEIAADYAKRLKSIGFRPDIIIGHHGWGELLNLVDIFPQVPILGYFEFFYSLSGSDVDFDPEFPISSEAFPNVRLRNWINFQALGLNQYGQTPTTWQHGTYPEWARPSIKVIKEGVDLDVCKPNPILRMRPCRLGGMTVLPNQKLLTFVARNLEPYRGFHTLMRALPKILNARPDIVISIVGGDQVSYGPAHRMGPWRGILLKELKGKLDLSRVHFFGTLPYKAHISLLKRSDVHVYLTYPFVASWSLREALACGCTIVGGDTETVKEFITHGVNGWIVPTLDAEALASGVLTVLGDPALAARLGENARIYCEAELDLKDCLETYRDHIELISGRPII